jgi:hypothetical protein
MNRIKRHNLINYSIDKFFDKLNSTQIMAHKLNVFKADLNNVFVKGNASSLQMARVFLILAIPVMVTCLIGLHSIKY